MKKNLICVGIIAATLSACASTKDVSSPIDTAYLSGSQWNVLTIEGQSVSPNASAMMFFKEDNTFAGHTGCNKFFGNYSLESHERLKLEAAGSTRMACPSDLMNQEQRMMKAIEAVSKAQLNGKTLQLISSTGDILLTLKK